MIAGNILFLIAGNLLFLMLINALTMLTNLISSDVKKIQEKWFEIQTYSANKNSYPDVKRIEKLKPSTHENFFQRVNSIDIPINIPAFLKFQYWMLKLGENDTNTYAYEINYNNINLILKVWKTDKPLIIVTHGWIAKYNDQGVYSIKNAYAVKYPDGYNIITLGWITYYQTFLNVASKCKEVGLALSHFLIKLVSLRIIIPSNIHMIGHNLGAHVLGVCGKNFYKLTKHKISRITGLNPTGPMTMNVIERWRLGRTLQTKDAEFVDLIHTAKIDKFPMTTGDVEFYPNGGYNPQNGCEDINYENYLTNGEENDKITKLVVQLFCSDAKSYEYYVESINNESAFISTLSKSYQHFENLENSERTTNHMGHHVNTKQGGTFYLKTKKKSPYSMDPTEEDGPTKIDMATNIDSGIQLK